MSALRYIAAPVALLLGLLVIAQTLDLVPNGGAQADSHAHVFGHGHGGAHESDQGEDVPSSDDAPQDALPQEEGPATPSSDGHAHFAFSLVGAPVALAGASEAVRPPFAAFVMRVASGTRPLPSPVPLG